MDTDKLPPRKFSLQPSALRSAQKKSPATGDFSQPFLLAAFPSCELLRGAKGFVLETVDRSLC